MAFFVVGLGTSVTWGQGLPEDRKFTTLVANTVAGMSPRESLQ